MSAGSSVAVLLASDMAQRVIPEPTFDLDLVRRAIREAPLSDRSTDLAPAIDQRHCHAAAPFDSARGGLCVHRRPVLAAGGGSAKIQRSLDQVGEKIRAHIVLVGNHEEHNRRGQ